MARKAQEAAVEAPLLLTSQQVAERLGTTAGNVRAAARRGLLPAPQRYPGLGLRWPAEVISRWVAEAGRPTSKAS